MEKAVDDFRKEAQTLRTGRANASILDNIRVDYHGTPMPVNQLGTVTTPDATMIVISPWDPSAVPLIDKAIRKVIERQNLERAEMAEVFGEMMDGRASDVRR